MAERLEVDIRQSITVNDQTQGAGASRSTPQIPSAPAQPTQGAVQAQGQAGTPQAPSPVTPEAIPTAQSQAMTPESAAPEVQTTKPEPTTSERIEQTQPAEPQEKEDFLSRSVKKIKQLESAGEALPDYLEKLKKRYLRTPGAVQTEQAQAKKPKAVPEARPEIVEAKLVESEVVPAKVIEVPPVVKPPVVSGAAKAAVGATEAAIESAAVTTAETAAVVGTEAATVGAEVAAAGAGGAGGAGLGAALGMAGGPPGMILGAIAAQVGGEQLTKAMNDLIDTVKLLDQSMMQMAKDATEFNPQVALAEAQAEIADMFSQMRRAKALGPDLSEFIEARSDFMVDLQDLITEIAPIFIDFMTGVLKALDYLVATMKAIVEIVKEFWNSPLGVFLREIGSTSMNGASVLIQGFIDNLFMGKTPPWIESMVSTVFRSWMRQKEKDDFSNEMQQRVKDFLTPGKLKTRLSNLENTKPRGPRKGF